ncbi:hypothetical protein [Sphingosinicella terrae]|uniref:hypothetical protein n=1 Tax=Sphingosinicella terrae TaxID=2172047 RepID=UPI000E0D5746|nr:hypothetical protein [Sphingosinicella terrae]
MRSLLTTLLLGAALLPAPAFAQPIDRHALVSRHSPVLTAIDAHAPLMVGNGEIGFTADMTGLQTFPEAYSPLAPLLTMAQWAWHSFPNPGGFTEADGLAMVPVPGRGEQPYPWIRDWSEIEARPALAWLRENPHRFSLARIGLAMTDRAGRPARVEQLTHTRQRLDLWTGTLHSAFRFDGVPVTVETRVHPQQDLILVRIRSPLVAAGRIGVDIVYPGVSRTLNPDPSDWSVDEAHRTEIVAGEPGRIRLRRQLDATSFHSTIAAPGATIAAAGAHAFRIRPAGGDTLVLMIGFERNGAAPAPAVAFEPAAAAAADHWRSYWTSGGAIDFSGSTDARAAELERRVVLSQYLSAVNGSGSLPPQEEGLFSNSWNGKFHLEVHPLHAAHFAAWGRPERLERSLAWYLETLDRARAVAQRHGVEGAWWTKMSGPEGRNSPSTINPFIMWQQPHPIYMAELVWRTRRDRATLERYAELVEATAALLASWPRRDGVRLVLGPPIIPVQENHPPLTTVNPAFETEYFRWGLATAQAWRERLGQPRRADWDAAIAALAPPAQRDGLYLPVESAPDFWRAAASPACSQNAIEPPCLNRDHPSFLMAYGWIAGGRIDSETMRRTLRATEAHWDLRQTWGWDFPIVAMTAARLGEPEGAVDWLFRDLPNNRWGTSGMTPRIHLEAHAADLFAPGTRPAGPDGPGYRRAAETYFPSNGSLLLAVGMMAAGWDGSQGEAPGFPREGWRVRVEGIRPLP